MKDVVNIHKNQSLSFNKDRFVVGFQGLSRESIEKVLISFGIQIELQDRPILNKLYAFYSTRTAVIHTNPEDFSKTEEELGTGLEDLELALDLLISKIHI